MTKVAVLVGAVAVAVFATAALTVILGLSHALGAFLGGMMIGGAAPARRAAERIGALGAGAVIVTGGHAPGPEVIDLVFDGRHFVELRTERVGGPRVHGTGCAFSSALAAGLAENLPLPEAAAQAQRYVAGAMADAHALGWGALLLDHFWNAQLRAKARS